MVCLTFCLFLQAVAAWGLGICRLPDHQGCVVVRLGNFRGPWTLGDSLKIAFRNNVIRVLISNVFSSADEKMINFIVWVLCNLTHTVLFLHLKSHSSAVGLITSLKHFLHSCSMVKGETSDNGD